MTTRKILLCIALTLTLLPASAKKLSVKALRELAAKGTPTVTDQSANRNALEESVIRYVQTLDGKLSVEGYVTGSAKYPYHANNELPYQHSFFEGSQGLAMATAWLMNKDGKCGVRLIFKNEKQCQKLVTFSFSEINLKGARLIQEGRMVTVMDLTDANIVFSEPCDPSYVPVREKTIGQLTDDDLFTFVRLKDCEFLIKNGAFINVLEEYMMRSVAGRNMGWNHTAGWGRLIGDGNCDRVFMHMNTKFINRRVGGGIPQGKGTIEGILVNTYLPRWGHLSCYGIRPITDSSIQFEWQGEPGYKTLAAWDWNRPSQGLVSAEYGAGMMTCEAPGEIGRTFDTDNPAILKKGEAVKDLAGIGGRVDNGAMQIKARACDWWDWETDRPRGLMIICSTMGKTGKEAFVAFTANAGNGKPEGSEWYPSWWTVSWSTDGKNWTRSTDADINLRALPYNYYGRPLSEPDGEKYVMCAESALGYQECLFRLPASALGQRRLFVRIHPSRKIAASKGYMHRDIWALRPECTETCYVNFGEIIVGYR